MFVSRKQAFYQVKQDDIAIAGVLTVFFMYRILQMT